MYLLHDGTLNALPMFSTHRQCRDNSEYKNSMLNFFSIKSEFFGVFRVFCEREDLSIKDYLFSYICTDGFVGYFKVSISGDFMGKNLSIGEIKLCYIAVLPYTNQMSEWKYLIVVGKGLRAMDFNVFKQYVDTMYYCYTLEQVLMLNWDYYIAIEVGFLMSVLSFIKEIAKSEILNNLYYYNSHVHTSRKRE